MKEIIEDVNKRGNLVAVIIEDSDGQLQVISYDDSGAVNYLSGKMEAMAFYKKMSGGGVIPMCELTRKAK